MAITNGIKGRREGAGQTRMPGAGFDLWTCKKQKGDARQQLAFH
jgi:hypothetical protein